MDDKSKESAQYFPGETTGASTSGTGTATRMREEVSHKASDVVIDTVTNFRRRAADKLEGTRQSAAGTLESTASSLHSGVNHVTSSLHSGTDQFASKLHSRADQVSGLGHSAADGLQSAADYIRRVDLNSIGKDLEDVVRQYPIPSLTAAAIAGFLLAWGLGNRD
jgi:hypothetical protein